ncbi:MMPL family transporter [Cohnella lubricantis]|uniref:MMPL family transporter n=1 Tax=Cohnella lubricantis TaxID=2163172 RepID=A0A841TLF3_9BACL|nr:MMPL family transporter [Cohnella lubricantis]MBB6679757.1 MMPL family transporter [Cohnella lubricantis]MBP2119450.1 RND superfamily putative drug exporter [Cohnella lubricantis]
MSTFLYKLGRQAYGKPWYFIGGWIVILAVVAAMLGVNGMSTSTEIKLEGTDAQKVLDKLEKVLPEAAGGRGSVVFTAPEGERLDTPERVAAITDAVSKVYQLDYVINPADYAAAAGADSTGGAAVQGEASREAGPAGTAGAGTASAGTAGAGTASTGTAGAGTASTGTAGADPSQLPPYGPLMADGTAVPGVLIASDGSVALFQFQFTVLQTSLPEGVADSIVDVVNQAGEGTGITVLPSDTLQPVDIPIGSNEVYGLVIAILVLIVSLGSIVAAGLPILIALFGVAIGVGGAYAISSFITMTSITPVLALMVGLAVGIDYALFIVNRQRRLIIDQGLTAREAARRAVGTAGSAVFFAGLTVIIALCGLLVIGLSFLSVMALVASVTVFLDVLIALTLLPALLGLIGERICSRKARDKNRSQAKGKRHGIAERWVKGVVKFRWLIIVGVIAILGAAALPVADMKMGMPDGGSANLDTAQRQSYDAISRGFGEGYNGPLMIVAEPKDPSGAITQETLYGLVQDIQQVENVSVVSPLGVSGEGKTAILNVIPKTGPTDEATHSLVKALRDSDSTIAQTYGVTLGVTGFTAINIDMSAKLAEVFPIYIVIIVIVSLLILLLVFRSILVPIKATVGFLLSVLATFGLTTAVYQWEWLHSLFGFDTGGPILSFLPIMITGILYGLAMDYQVFLVSSMRESYVHGHRGNESVIHGYDQASRVVVAAAIIMVSVFAGFIFAHDIMIKQVGFALAIGILLDAFVVRMALVPAVMSLFGDKAWSLPRWLDRLLPNLDVEGDKLLAELKAKDAEAGSPSPRAMH